MLVGVSSTHDLLYRFRSPSNRRLPCFKTQCPVLQVGEKLGQGSRQWGRVLARLLGCRLVRKKPNHTSCVAAANYKSIYSLTSARPLCLDRVTSIHHCARAPQQPCSRSPLGIERKKLPPRLQEAIEVVAELFRGGNAACTAYGCYRLSLGARHKCNPSQMS